MIYTDMRNTMSVMLKKEMIVKILFFAFIINTIKKN